MKGTLFSGESARDRIVALFDNETTATTAIARIVGEGGLDGDQVKLVRPGERHFGRKLEPDNDGIVRTAIRAHVSFCALGALAGLIVFGVLYARDLPEVVSNAAAAAGCCAFFGALLGLLAGGLMTARPGHQPVIAGVREAVRQGQWAIIVHPSTAAQYENTSRVLNDMAAKQVHSF